MKIKRQNKILYLLLIIFTIAITASCGGGDEPDTSGSPAIPAYPQYHRGTYLTPILWHCGV